MSDRDLEGIELTHLRYFVVVAEELHFGRAAERLNMSQPPLTQQIQRLEARLGCPLFHRTTRRTELTDAGRSFLESARAVLQEVERAVRSTRRIARGELGRITVASPPSLVPSVLSPAVLELRRRFPAVAVQLREMATSRVAEAVESGIADVGLLRGPEVPESLEVLLSWREPLVAFLPHNHPAAGARRFNLRMLAHEPFVFFPRDLGPSFYEELLGHCRKAGFVPEIVQEATQWPSVIGLVRAGVGVSIGPDSVSGLLKGAVTVRRLPKLQTKVTVVRSARKDNPVVPQLVEILKGLATSAFW